MVVYRARKPVLRETGSVHVIDHGLMAALNYF